MKQDPKEPPTLESLLRLKRAEVPTPEFWTRFEQELRDRQLAAIVEKRPWWCAFPRAYVFALRHNRQIGSLAALAVASFFGYHEFHVATSAPSLASGSRIALAAPSNVLSAAPRVPVSVGKPASAVGLVRASSVPRASPAGPDLDAGFAGDVNQAEMPSARLIAANLAAARINGVESTGGFMAFQTGIESQESLQNGQLDDPLANMTTPSEERRSRLMASATPAMAAGNEVSERVSERIASRLSDDRLYESMSRYGVGATAVSIKF
jgi:hypothetical protein